MLIGVPKEIKTREYRVGLTPANVREFIAHGHSVLVQKNAAYEIGFTDTDYMAAGAAIADTAEEIFAKAEMIVKVKEPQESEYTQLREGQILYTYLHLAPDVPQTDGLIKSGCVAVAYETVTDSRGGLPLLAPMSEVAGRMSIQAGAHALEMSQGGRGMLLGGVPGVVPAKVTVIGGGVVGTNAARMAAGLGADVVILDRSIPRLAQLDDLFQGRAKTVFSTAEAIEEHVLSADLTVGAVLIPGAAAPKLVTADMVAHMPRGSVLVDVAIDQGGCFETAKPTTHAEPTYVVDEVVHYCVANMPGGVARTSTLALNNATLAHGLALADKGWQQALKDDTHLRAGLNVCEGKVTYEAVARDQNRDYTPAEMLL
ncbi:alanine dehydrogenase [Eilatimonas milleporae]|uniref:Alanine dehydrogenase n=1 Tax=Eilatimonas milleporae TaxID=911205 RepID=A0A3M0CFV7_9PROT|nr:alanine dehydrogenase [Eilatimonas milleporae]RMB08464.1 L-alanine dehydrogenase [Eilatimonas milleporae]